MEDSKHPITTSQRFFLGRSPGEGNGNPLQYSCLGNPMDRGAWQATVHGVAKSRTHLSEHKSSPCWLCFYWNPSPSFPAFLPIFTSLILPFSALHPLPTLAIRQSHYQTSLTPFLPLCILPDQLIPERNPITYQCIGCSIGILASLGNSLSLKDSRSEFLTPCGSVSC